MSSIAQHRQPEPGDGGESTPSRATDSSTSRAEPSEAKRSKQDAHRHKLLAIFRCRRKRIFWCCASNKDEGTEDTGARLAFVSGKPESLFFFFFVSHPFTVTSSGSYRHIERYVLTERKATTSFVCPPSLRPSLSGVAHRHSLTHTHTLGRCGGSESKPPCLGGSNRLAYCSHGDSRLSGVSVTLRLLCRSFTCANKTSLFFLSPYSPLHYFVARSLFPPPPLVFIVFM